MGYTNFKNGVSSMGVPVAPLTKGKVFFVDLESGEDDNSGTIITQPLLTLSAAITKCSSGRGDIIYVMGKSTVTSAIAISSLDNISIIGIPNSNTPHGAQTRIANSSCNVFEITNSHKITIDGLRFTVTGAYSGITLAGGNGCFQAVIRDLAFQLNGASAKGISSSSANSPQAGTYENLYFRGYAAAKSSHGIHFSNTSTGNLMRHCYFYGLDNAIVMTGSASDILDFVYATDCTASFNVTGATSLITNWSSNVAPSGTAKVSASGTSGAAV